MQKPYLCVWARTAQRAFGVMTLAVAVGLGAGCTYTFVHRAERAYNEGRYLDAAERLAQHEAEVAALRPARRAVYATYRGLALLRLGDRDGAHHWLTVAVSLDQKTTALLPKQRRQLRAGLAELGPTAGGPGPAASTSGPSQAASAGDPSQATSASAAAPSAP
ncbi:MAG: hypothetical protein EXR75_06560 [Myxococcales bacterium]|nr:hypothetical protein [Myxococcales bacterium]